MEDDAIKDQPTEIGKVTKARANVKLSLEASIDWRKEAKEDYRFVQGKQWDDKDVQSLEAQKRPAITINRCRPLINQVSGYFGQNMTEPNYLPRANGDDEVCNIAKGVNKYVYDKCMFSRHKKKVGRDRLICGKGYYWVFYDFDYEIMNGMIKMERRSPFEMFVDPEGVQEDLSDAEYCGSFSWESPDELEQVYEEHADEIKLLVHKLDSSEIETVNNEPMWYSKQLKKVRVVQYWYKERSYRNVYQIEGQVDMMDETDDMKAMVRMKIPGIKKHRIPECKIKYLTFCDDVLLEANDSPYKHKRFPLVPEYCYYTGEKDENDSSLEPAGLIRDIKPVQRELNKHRSQRMHIVNTQANGMWVSKGVTTPEFDTKLKQYGTTPGVHLNMPAGMESLERISPDGISASNVEMERVSGEDFYTISGINPETMGNADSPGQMSGVAIDRRQKASFTQVSDIADEANYSERLIQDLLWGDKGRPGLIPQYFTEEMVMRIVGDDGEQKFIQLANGQQQARNEQDQLDTMGQPQVDEQGQTIKKVLYDLSKFEFDIVVVPMLNTPTLMAANLEQLIAAKQAGINVPDEMILENIPVGNKQKMIKKMQEQAQGASKIEPPSVNMSVPFKDLPIEGQIAAMAAIGVQVTAESLIQQQMLKNPPKQVTQPNNQPQQQPRQY